MKSSATGQDALLNHEFPKRNGEKRQMKKQIPNKFNCLVDGIKKTIIRKDKNINLHRKHSGKI